MAAALEGASLAVLVDHAQAASTVDPDAAKALAQLTQNGQPAVPPPRRAGRPDDPVDGAPPAVDVTTTPAPPLPTDTAPAPPPVEAAPPPPPPVVDPPAAVAPAPAVDVIDSPPPTTTAAVSAGPGVQFLPAVSATDPPPVAGGRPGRAALRISASTGPGRTRPAGHRRAAAGRAAAARSGAGSRDGRGAARGPGRRRPRRRARRRGRPESLSGRWRATRGDRGLDGSRCAGRRPAARAAGDGVARGVRAAQPDRRRPRLGRLLPDAHRHLGSRSLRRLPAEPRAADALVHRPRARDQGQADRRGRRDLRPGSEHLRQLGRRRRGAVRALPRALPATSRRRARAARPGRVGTGSGHRSSGAVADAAAAGAAPRFRPPMSRDR